MGTALSKKAIKEAERAAFLDSVRGTLAKAQQAAHEAYEDTVKKLDVKNDGVIRDSCGGAYIKMYQPSYKLRIALKELGEIESSGRDGWVISTPNNYVKHQGVSLQDNACRAACNILKDRLVGEAEFYVHSYTD